MKYFYCPENTEKKFHDLSDFPLEHNKKDFILHATQNKLLQQKFREIHEKSVEAKDTISLPNLQIVYQALGNVSSGFVTFASQQKIADMTGLHKCTVNRAIKWLRKGGLVFVEHRYKTEGNEKRRTTSKITLIAFIKFCEWARRQAINARNKINQHTAKMADALVDKTTGEILPGGANLSSHSAVLNLLYTAARKIILPPVNDNFLGKYPAF